MTTCFLVYRRYDDDGNPVFRPLIMQNECHRPYLNWRREFAKEGAALPPTLLFKWEASEHVNVSDFPPSGEPWGIWSDRAVGVLGRFFAKSGGIFAITVEGEPGFNLFFCREKVEAEVNADFNPLNPFSLRTISIAGNSELPEVFKVMGIPALLVGEHFRAEAESAHLTGMVFHPVDVLH